MHLSQTTAVGIGTGTFAVDSPTSSSLIAYRTGDRVRGYNGGDASKYFEGVVTAVNASPVSISINVDKTVNTTSNNNIYGYNLSTVGIAGATGANGSGYYAHTLDNTAVSITSSRTFNLAVPNTLSELAYRTGDRIRGRVATDPTKYFEGYVISLGSSPLSITVSIDFVNGTSGANIGGYTFGLVGEKGAAGTTDYTQLTNLPDLTTATLTKTTTTDTDPLTISSKNGHGGTGYGGLITLENTSSGATNTKKFIRLNNTGTLEFINSDYTATIFSLNNNGLTTIAQATGVTNNTPTANALSLNNHSFIFDDGNMHINTNDGAIWINSNNAQAVQINTQGTAVGGGLIVSGKATSDNTGDSGWISVTSGFNSSFSGTGVAYRKLNNVLYLRGRVTGGTAGSGSFFLPTGYRPATDFVIPTQQYGTGNITYTTVQTDGNVIPNSSATWLTGIGIPLG